MNDVASTSADCSSSTVTTGVYPVRALSVLSRAEVARLLDASEEVSGLLRQVALAVLTSGEQGDDAEQLLETYRDFRLTIHQVNRGVRLDLENAPACAFVDGVMIRGVREMLSAAVRDIAFFRREVEARPHLDLDSSEGITSAVFEILRNARALNTDISARMVVCWGGHSISRAEYDYSKEVGYQLGLRGIDICTGCGPGAMKGPMKGATVGHAKQRTLPGRYVGISEPGIIAAESPNPIVSELIIMPDIEKRLEAFVRLGHGIIVFPGGAGTAEEILYLLGILLNPANGDMPFPLVFTGPESARAYFEEIDHFIGLTLGQQARDRYRIIIDNPVAVARYMVEGLERVHQWRMDTNDTFYFNWLLEIDQAFQAPFNVDHAAMAALDISPDLPPHELAANLRQLFSGIVAGNVKPQGVRAIRRFGPFEISGDRTILRALDELLQRFVTQHRMKLPGGKPYEPCYRIVG